MHAGLVPSSQKQKLSSDVFYRPEYDLKGEAYHDLVMPHDVIKTWLIKRVIKGRSM